MTSSRSGAPRGSGYGMAPKEKFSRGRPSPARAKHVYYDSKGTAIDPEVDPELHAASAELEANRVLQVTEDRKREAAEDQAR